jgi:hypothetical protein
LSIDAFLQCAAFRAESRERSWRLTPCAKPGIPRHSGVRCWRQAPCRSAAFLGRTFNGALSPRIPAPPNPIAPVAFCTRCQLLMWVVGACVQCHELAQPSVNRLSRKLKAKASGDPGDLGGVLAIMATQPVQARPPEPKEQSLGWTGPLVKQRPREKMPPPGPTLAPPKFRLLRRWTASSRI